MREYLTIGKILSPWGVKGQIKVEPLTDNPNRFKHLQEVYIDDSGEAICYPVESAILLNQRIPVLKLQGIDSKEEAENKRGYYIRIDRKDAVQLPENHYFICDIIGLTVYDGKANEPLGIITDVIETGANDVYVIGTKDKKEILIPAIKEVIKKIDIEKGKVVIEPLEGLI